MFKNGINVKFDDTAELTAKITDRPEMLHDGDLESNSPSSQEYRGVDITFQDVSVAIKKKKILDEATGYMRRGSLTALMGPSGSGKTTLVDCLTFRKNTGIRTGTILYEGQKPTQMFLRHAVAYVQQEDSLIDNLTVVETMRYNLDLITGGRWTKKDEDERVESVLLQLALDGCRNVVVGNAFRRGISGGQRKRLNIAINLLRHPCVLVLDEPTSGLDSYTAFEVISAVKTLSAAGLTVLSTIHAPSTSIFHLFDRLMVILDGRMVYAGDVQSEHICEFFRGCELVGKIADDSADGSCWQVDRNAADWLTAIAVQTSRLNQSDKLGQYYTESNQKRSVDEHIEELLKMHGKEEASALLATIDASSFLQRTGIYPTWAILKHRMLADYKQINFIVPRVGEKILFAVVILTLYWGIADPLPPNTDQTTELARPIQITTALYMWSVLPVFGSVAVIPSIFNERAMFNREKEAGYYNSGSYLTAKVVEEATINAVTSVLLGVAVWFALSLSGQFPLFWLVYFVTSLVGVTMSYLCSTIAPNTEYAIIGVSAVNVCLLFFVGLLIRWEDIPAYWRWLVDINYLHYSWGAVMKNQFTVDDMFISVPVLEYFHLNDSVSGWIYLIYAACFVLFFFLSAMLSMRFINFSRR